MLSDRTALPQLGGNLFLTDAGLETSLIFYEGVDLPCFATFPLLESEEGRRRLSAYFRPFLEMARHQQTGFILDTVTWRANADWGAQLGYDAAALDRINRQAVQFADDLAREFVSPTNPIVVNGVIGPRGDGYRVTSLMSADEAEQYHGDQIATFSDTTASMVTVLTVNYIDEAIGIARAAHAHGIPAVISFTVETDGKLPSGDNVQHAVEAVDRETDSSPAYYMINCAHPSHFGTSLGNEWAWRDRVHGLRANASRKSHAELDEATEIDAGDPIEFAAANKAVRDILPRLNVLGGCCGTDYRHVEAVAKTWGTM